MRKFFATFPAGAPGAALLLLRLSVAVHVSVAYVLHNARDLPIWAQAAALLAAVLLGFGYLTPLTSLLSASAAAMTTIHLGMFANADCAFVLADGIVVAMLGPGAYSVDARLFGRHVVVLTNRNNRASHKP